VSIEDWKKVRLFGLFYVSILPSFVVLAIGWFSVFGKSLMSSVAYAVTWFLSVIITSRVLKSGQYCPQCKNPFFKKFFVFINPAQKVCPHCGSKFGN